jgi:hypothetical protein
MTMAIKQEDDRTFSPEELRAMLDAMQRASDAFYLAATRTNVHGFIEFTGLMNEYIKICRHALAKGQDFTLANTHSGRSLSMEHYEAAYLAEKLQCIFSWSPEASNAVVDAIMDGRPDES